MTTKLQTTDPADLDLVLEEWLLNPKYLAWLAANEPEGLKRLKVALAKAWLAKYGDTE